MIAKLGDLTVTSQDADPSDNSEMCQQPGFRLTYQPGQ
jgi:hypothetical protein